MSTVPIPQDPGQPLLPIVTKPALQTERAQLMSQNVRPAESGARLNYLYKQYLQQSNSDRQNALFAEIQNYAQRLVTNLAKQQSVSAISVEDAVQESCLKVSQKIDSFKHRSRFSSWVFAIVRNAFYDELRKDSRRKELPRLEWKHYDETSGKTSRRCPNLAEQERDGFGATDGDTDGIEPVETTVVPFLSTKEVSVEQDKLNLQLDRKRLEASLSDEDFGIFHSYLDGESAAQTAQRLNVKTKHVYNRRAVIRNRALQVRKFPPISRTISAKDAEDLAQGSRHARQFINEAYRLEKARWDRLTVTSQWHSPHQVFRVENFTVFGSSQREKRSSVGITRDLRTKRVLPSHLAALFFRGQGVFHPQHGYGVIDRAGQDTEWATVRCRDGMRAVRKSELQGTMAGADTRSKQLNSDSPSPRAVIESENLSERVSKSLIWERHRIEESNSLLQ